MMEWTAAIEEYFSKWTWANLLAGVIAAVILLTFANISFNYVDPYWQAAAVYGDRAKFFWRWRHRSNPDAFVTTLPAKNSLKEPIKIAWIAGSDVIITKSLDDCKLLGTQSLYSLPWALAEQISSIDGRPVRVDGYFASSIGVGDMRRAALYAARKEPADDIVVLSLNPIVAFDDFIVFGRDSRQRAGILFETGARWFDIAFSLPALRPSETMIEALGHVSRMIYQRGYTKKIDQLSAKLSKFPFLPVATDIPADTDETDDSIKSAIDMGLDAKFQAEGVDDKTLALFKPLFVGDLTPNGVAARYLTETLIDLRDSGKPTILYIPPINKFYLKFPTIVRRMNLIEARLSAIIRGVNARNIHADLSLWRTYQEPLGFRDRIHLTCGPTIVDRVAQLVQEATGTNMVLNSREKVYGPDPLPEAAK